MAKLNDSTNSKSVKAKMRSEWNYEETVEKIEKIVASIESGKLELSEVFDEFAAAVDHLRQCETFLAEKRQQVDLLIETLIESPALF